MSECIVIICLKKYLITCYEHTTGINKVLQSEQTIGLLGITKYRELRNYKFNNANVTKGSRTLFTNVNNVYRLHIILGFRFLNLQTTQS